MSRNHTVFDRNATELRRLHDEVHTQWRIKRNSPAHVKAAETFRRQYDQLAFPGGLTAQLDAIKQLEPTAVEMAIRFLEADMRFFRSGYVKEEFVRRIKKAVLSPEQRERLAAVVERSISDGAARVASHLARLAPLVRSESFISSVRLCSNSKNAETRRRALHLLSVLHEH